MNTLNLRNSLLKARNNNEPLFLIEKVKEEDFQGYIDCLYAIDSRNLSYPWTRKHWEGLNLENYYLWLVKREEAVIGFCLFQFLNGDSTCHLLKIAISYEFRNIGAGKAVLIESLKALSLVGAKNCYLEVHEKNHAAIKLYEYFGFKICRKVSNFYKDGGNALCFLWSFSKI